LEFFKINIKAAGLNDFWDCLESHEISFSQLTETRYPVRGRTDGDDTDWFYLIQLERSGANLLFFDGIDDNNVNIKLTSSLFKAFDENNQIIRLRDNMFILNRDNFEPNKPNPDYKGNGTPSNTVQELNIMSPMLIIVRNTYFLLDLDKGRIKYVFNESWKSILTNYYTEIYHELQKKKVHMGLMNSKTTPANPQEIIN
jgi:hypothetical protein